MTQLMAKTPRSPTRDRRSELVVKNLKRFRDEAGLTQEQAAIASGVPLDRLRSWESGKVKHPAGDLLHLLAQIYGHVVDDFYQEDPPKPDFTNRVGVYLGGLPDEDAEIVAELREYVVKKYWTIKAAKRPKKS